MTSSSVPEIQVPTNARFQGQTTATPTSQPITSFRGSDLDTSLPLVGRAWLDSMEFGLDRRTNARIYDVRMAAIASCMHDSGLDYEPVPYPENGSYEDQVNPLDRAYARVMGYHPLPAAPIDPNIATEATTTAAGDCSNAVYPSTFGRLGNYFADSDQLRSDLANTMIGFEVDDASREVAQAWALCMGNAGYNYRSRQDPMLLYQEALTITEDEIATASRISTVTFKWATPKRSTTGKPFGWRGGRHPTARRSRPPSPTAPSFWTDSQNWRSSCSVHRGARTPSGSPERVKRIAE